VLTALRPLHIGSGIYELDANENPVRGQVTADGRAIMPGTSLKGAIRSIAEAITKSCVRITRSGIGRNLAFRGGEACRMVTPRQPATVCVCCSIFGALGYQGRVAFSDARLLTGVMTTHQIQSPYQPRDSARGYTDAQRLFNGRKFYYHGEPVAAREGEPYHVVAKNSDFEFTLAFESLSDAEMCLLVVAMGILDDIVIKVGGGKQAMLGSVEIVPRSLRLDIPEASFSDFSGGVKEIKEDVTKFLLDEVGQANQLINEDALDELMKIWAWPSERKAPTGMY
jgi:CRISPR/Cas system CSM-associated protein Csm3 (group 7 of RAMP superfamily)